MTSQTVAQRKADQRARLALLGLTEVRGIYLQPEKHAELKKLAQSIALKREKEKT